MTRPDPRIQLALAIIDHRRDWLCDADWQVLREVRDALRGKSIDEIREARIRCGAPHLVGPVWDNGGTTTKGAERCHPPDACPPLTRPGASL